MYRAWLVNAGKTHSNAVFRRWVLEEYRPGSCLCDITLLSPAPPAVTGENSTTMFVRVRNIGVLPWRLKPLETAGVHLGCHIFDEQDVYQGMGKSGLLDATVLPGEIIELTLVIPPLRRPGRYRLQMDMVDEQQCWFFQVGSQPLELELKVRE